MKESALKNFNLWKIIIIIIIIIIINCYCYTRTIINDFRFRIFIINDKY